MELLNTVLISGSDLEDQGIRRYVEIIAGPLEMHLEGLRGIDFAKGHHPIRFCPLALAYAHGFYSIYLRRPSLTPDFSSTIF